MQTSRVGHSQFLYFSPSLVRVFPTCTTAGKMSAVPPTDPSAVLSVALSDVQVRLQRMTQERDELLARLADTKRDLDEKTGSVAAMQAQMASVDDMRRQADALRVLLQDSQCKLHTAIEDKEQAEGRGLGWLPIGTSEHADPDPPTPMQYKPAQSSRLARASTLGRASRIWPCV